MNLCIMAMRLCSGTAAQAFSPATAAVTARLTSSCVADGTVSISSPVAGFSTSITSPLEASAAAPSMYIFMLLSPPVSFYPIFSM